jgi:hypothetical protein
MEKVKNMLYLEVCRNFTKRNRIGFLSLIAVVSQILLVPAAFSQSLVVSINITNPANVTFTATGAFSSVNETRGQGDGISFVGFFVASPTNNSAFSGNLTPSGSLSAFNTNFVSSSTDLNLFGPGGPNMIFTTTTAAFTGVGFDDMSYAIGNFAAPGTEGDIRTGFNSSNYGGIIGQYTVIPEPDTAMLVGFVGLALMLRRRKVG